MKIFRLIPNLSLQNLITQSLKIKFINDSIQMNLGMNVSLLYSSCYSLTSYCKDWYYKNGYYCFLDIGKSMKIEHVADDLTILPTAFKLLLQICKEVCMVICKKMGSKFMHCTVGWCNFLCRKIRKCTLFFIIREGLSRNCLHFNVLSDLRCTSTTLAKYLHIKQFFVY